MATNTLIQKLQQAWNRYFFTPENSLNLEIGRILFYACVFIFIPFSNPSGYGDVSYALFVPKSFYVFLGSPIFTHAQIDILFLAWKTFLVLSCVGLFTRFSTMATFLLSLYLFPLAGQFGKNAHDNYFLTVTMGVLAFSQCGLHLSVDRLFKQYILKKSQTNFAVGPEFNWPVRIILVGLCTVYLASGLSKIRHGGLSWVTTDTLDLYMIQMGLLRGIPWVGGPLAGFAFKDHVMYLLQFVTIIFETLYPLALFSRILRWPIVLTAISFHIGVTLMLNIRFDGLMICSLFWIRWDKIYSRLKAR